MACEVDALTSPIPLSLPVYLSISIAPFLSPSLAHVLSLSIFISLSISPFLSMHLSIFHSLSTSLSLYLFYVHRSCNYVMVLVWTAVVLGNKLQMLQVTLQGFVQNGKYSCSVTTYWYASYELRKLRKVTRFLVVQNASYLGGAYLRNFPAESLSFQHSQQFPFSSSSSYLITMLPLLPALLIAFIPRGSPSPQAFSRQVLLPRSTHRPRHP